MLRSHVEVSHAEVSHGGEEYVNEEEAASYTQLLGLGASGVSVAHLRVVQYSRVSAHAF